MTTKVVCVCDYCGKEAPATNQDGAYPEEWLEISRLINGGYVCSPECAMAWLAWRLGRGDLVVVLPSAWKDTGTVRRCCGNHDTTGCCAHLPPKSTIVAEVGNPTP